MERNPTIPKELYGRWWTVVEEEFNKGSKDQPQPKQNEKPKRDEQVQDIAEALHNIRRKTTAQATKTTIPSESINIGSSNKTPDEDGSVTGEQIVEDNTKDDEAPLGARQKLRPRKFSI